MRAILLSLAIVLLAACRFGGEDVSPFELSEPYRDAEVDAEAGAPVEDASVAPTPSDAQLMVSKPDSSAVDASEAEACTAPSVATCDPVAQTGCLFSQCVVDRTKSLTGRCVLATGSSTAGCMENELSTSCPAGSGCYDNSCKKLCFCDGDCGSGECCGATPPSSPGMTIGTCQVCP